MRKKCTNEVNYGILKMCENTKTKVKLILEEKMGFFDKL